MALADRGNRKGWDTAYVAFYEAFRADDDVALVIKSRTPDLLKAFPADGVRDPVSRKMRFWCAEVEHVRDIYAQADCYVFPTCAEGWGSPPREAAACGLPVLATNYSGTAVGCEHWAIPLNDYFLADSADLPTPQQPGKWARVRSEELAHWMRWCYEHRDDARQKGLQSAAWLRANQTWGHSARALHDLITEIDVRQPARLQAEWDAYRIEAAQSEQTFIEQFQQKEYHNGKNGTLIRTAQGADRPLDGAGHLERGDTD
jgi:glycosyltransferase involved in cell wall biosynthesis